MNKVEYSNNKIQYQLDKLEFHVNKIGIENVDNDYRLRLIDILKIDEVLTESELTIISPDVPSDISSEESTKSFELESNIKTNNDDDGLYREVDDESTKKEEV